MHKEHIFVAKLVGLFVGSDPKPIQQDPDSLQWQSLPYEIAAAFVRTLSLHWKQLMDARCIFNSHLLDDENGEKEATKKAKQAYDDLRSKKRFIIMNRWTSQLATQDWIQKNVTVNKDGKPEIKNGKRVKPWIMILACHLKGVGEADLSLQLTDVGQAFPIRCFEFKENREETKISTLVTGYDFGEGDHDQDDNNAASDAESLETLPGDEAGLEGDGSAIDMLSI